MLCITRRPPHALPALGAAALLALATACADQSGPLAPSEPTLAPGQFGKPHSVPVRGRIAFSYWPTGDQEIYSIKEDGTGLVRLTYHAGADREPAWSPDGKRIAFVREVDTTTHAGDVFVMNADGSGTKRLTSFEENYFGLNDLAWSPDGHKIAFSRRLPGPGLNVEIFVMNATGGSLTQLTSSAGFDTSPTWSPDGTQIAFASQGGDEAAAHQIYVMNADGTGATPLTTSIPDCTAGCFHPSWSPDGSQILFDAKGGISRMNLATGFTFVVTDDGNRGSWSPDGLKVVYGSLVTRQYYTAFADGSDIQPLTAIVSVATFNDADWGRAP